MSPVQFPYPEMGWSTGRMRMAKARGDPGREYRELEGIRRGKEREARVAELGTDQLSPEEQFMYQHHIENLQRGGFKQPTGETSTYRAIGVEEDGKYYMLPTIWEGQQLSDEEAIRRARELGMGKFPSYRDQGEAEERYNSIHQLMERDLSPRRVA